MFSEFLQYLLSGVTIGATYALVGIGFAIIYNASHVINFAQGEFVMIGGMATVSLLGFGLPLPVAILGAILIAVITGLALEKFAVEPAKNAGVVTLIIITIGASIFIRGLAQVIWGKEFFAMRPFTGDDPIVIAGATILPQALWVLGVTLLVVVALAWFFQRTLLGKAIIATSCNVDAAKIMGINTQFILFFSFGLSALLGAVAGVLITPISLTSYDVGIMLGLKGFVGAVLGGLGSAPGAIVGGLLLGIAESMAAGYISSDYKDAVPFVLILLVLFFMPSGLFGVRGTERV
jgi:branched-chain amino acid transport system permease protein